MNDTPRTDAAMTRCACSSYVIEPDFARILEHENVLLRDDLDALQHTLRGMEVQQERLERENAALRHALQSIADEAVNHHETNLVSGITRLPRGYSEILNIAEAAIDAARKEAKL